MNLEIDKNFEYLIIKYINQNTKTEDLKLLLTYLKDSDNLRLFKLFIKINFFSIYVMNKMDKDGIIDIIKGKIKKDQKRDGLILFVVTSRRKMMQFGPDICQCLW